MEYEERVVNGFETWSWRGMLKMKWTGRITNGEVFGRKKEERLLVKMLISRRQSWIGHTVRHNEFAVNILEGAIFGKKMPWEDLDCSNYSKSPETQQLTVIQLWTEWFVK